MSLLLVVLRSPPGHAPDGGGDDALLVRAAAAATGLAPADVRSRLGWPLPRPLLVEGDDARARHTLRALEALGFELVACDPRAIPGDDERLVARSLELGPSGDLAATDERGNREEIPGASLLLIQRGARTVTKLEKSLRNERRLSLGRALLSGGFSLTKKVETETVRSTTTEDAFVLLNRGAGGRDVMLYERRLDYGVLGAERGPSSRANFLRLVDRIRDHAPGIPYDDRLTRAGFVSSLRWVSAEPVDLALLLVLLGRLRGAV